MSDKLNFCKTCRSNMVPHFFGYWPYDGKCPICKGNMEEIDIPREDFYVIKHTYENVDFYESMIKLHDEDIIEYEIKMSQFRANDQWYQEKHNPKPETKSKPDVLTCPKCGSTAVTTGARGANHFWGLIGASKTVNRCGNCGHTWKPRG